MSKCLGRQIGRYIEFPPAWPYLEGSQLRYHPSVLYTSAGGKIKVRNVFNYKSCLLNVTKTLADLMNI